METPLVKILVLMNNVVLICQIEEVGADIGEPDCKIIKPFIVDNNSQQKTLEPFLLGLTKQESFMMSSDKILTLADPTPTLLEKYLELTK